MAKPRDFFEDNAKRLASDINKKAPVVYNLHHGFHALIMQVDRLDAQLAQMSTELAKLRAEMKNR